MTIETRKMDIFGRMREAAQIDRVLMTLAAACLVPLFFHWAPWPFVTPIGAVWLPIFYAPAAAMLLFRPHAGLLASALAPALNHWMTGMPAAPLVPALTMELLLFSLLLLFFTKIFPRIVFNAVLAYGVSRCLSFFIWNLPAGDVPPARLADAFFTALPGTAVLLLINGVIVGHDRQKRQA